jgi:hypothetical protein
MDKKQINSKDLLLCFFYSPGQKREHNEPIIGRTKLTKMMFLFEKEIYSQFFKDEIEIDLPEFKPYYFGPFSKQLFDDLAFFESIGMIKATDTVIPISPVDKVESEEAYDVGIVDEFAESSFDSDEIFECEYSLASSGLRYVEDKVWGLLSQKQKEKLQAFKSQINKISLDALLRYVYNKYPEETTQSKIANKYLSNSEG